MIPKKTTKMIVKDGSGNLVQLLPEIETASTIDASSDVPVSSAALASALEDIEDSLPASALLDVMEEEPTALNTTELDDEALIVWMPSESWSITIDTEAKTAGSKMGEISLIFNPNDEASQNASMTVDWGDGTVVTYTPETAKGYTYPKHEYAIPGIYDIIIESNDFDKLYIGNILTDEGEKLGPAIHATTLKRINNALPKIKGMHVYINNNYMSIEDFDGNSGNTNTDWGFFAFCESLESIPEDLFINNSNITNFYGFFMRCSSLQSIPSNLFANNIAATSFDSCFANCYALGDFTLHISSSSVSTCSNFVNNKSGTTRTVYVPSNSTTQTTFNAQASNLGLTIIGE